MREELIGWGKGLKEMCMLELTSKESAFKHNRTVNIDLFELKLKILTNKNNKFHF